MEESDTTESYGSAPEQEVSEEMSEEESESVPDERSELRMEDLMETPRRGDRPIAKFTPKFSANFKPVPILPEDIKQPSPLMSAEKRSRAMWSGDEESADRFKKPGSIFESELEGPIKERVVDKTVPVSKKSFVDKTRGLGTSSKAYRDASLQLSRSFRVSWSRDGAIVIPRSQVSNDSLTHGLVRIVNVAQAVRILSIMLFSLILLET